MKKITHIFYLDAIDPWSKSSFNRVGEVYNVLNFWRQPQIWLWYMTADQTINSLSSHDFTGRWERRVSFRQGLMFLVYAMVWRRTLQAILHVRYGAKNVMILHTGLSTRRHFLETLFTQPSFHIKTFVLPFTWKLCTGALESTCL